MMEVVRVADAVSQRVRMTSNTAQFFGRQRDIDWIAGWVTRRRDTDCPSAEVWPVGHMGVWEIV